MRPPVMGTFHFRRGGIIVELTLSRPGRPRVKGNSYAPNCVFESFFLFSSTFDVGRHWLRRRRWSRRGLQLVLESDDDRRRGRARWHGRRSRRVFVDGRHWRSRWFCGSCWSCGAGRFRGISAARMHHIGRLCRVTQGARVQSYDQYVRQVSSWGSRRRVSAWAILHEFQ